MTDIKFLNDDGSEYIPSYERPQEPQIPFAPNTPGLLLVAISNDPSAIKLKDIKGVLNTYINKFPALIQATPDISVGLCIFDNERNGWRPLSTDDLRTHK